MLVLIPLSELLPFLLLGSAFLSGEQLNAFFYANLAWGFLAACVIQCLVFFQVLTQTSRLDVVIPAAGGVLAWIAGYTLAVAVLYLASTAVSCALLAFVLGYELHATTMLGAMLLAVPVSFGLVSVVLGLELAYGRVFHLVNVGLDCLQVVSCVLYPASALAALLRPAAFLSPVTWLNEFLRSGAGSALAVSALLCLGLGGVSVLWIGASLRRYASSGSVRGVA